jgi:hypothetical protein
MNDLILSDAAVPVAGSGQTLTDAGTGGDHEATVVPGATYALTTNDTAVNTFVLGVATILTAANILWVVPPASTGIIRVPDDVTTLHYESLVNGGVAYLRRLAMP